MVGQGDLRYGRPGGILDMVGQVENLGYGRAGGILEMVGQGESWIW